MPVWLEKESTAVRKRLVCLRSKLPESGQRGVRPAPSCEPVARKTLRSDPSDLKETSIGVVPYV